MNRQAGVALLLVLWVIALLSILLGGLAVGIQLQQRQALWQRNQVQASFAAQAGLSLAVAGLLREGAQRWRADGQVHRAVFDGSLLRIRIRSERGKLDLNAGPVGSLEKLLRSCGASAEAAQITGHALATRRNKGPLRMLEEFRELPGVTHAQYRCALPFMTLWSGNPQPDPTLASPTLAKSLGMPRSSGVPLDPGQILTVTSQATLPSHFQGRLKVTLVLLPGKDGAKPYRVLRWQE